MSADPTIFVALASYCDPELLATIEDCIDKSTRPDLLRFGICHQFDPEGEDAIHEDATDQLGGDSRFRTLTFHHSESEGGCWARNLVQGLYAGETFTLQVDAHTRFIPGWDDALIGMYRRFPATRPLITGFPPLYDREAGTDVIPDYPDDPVVPTTVVPRWSPDGWIHHPTEVIRKNRKHPRRTRVLSGAFVFTSGEWNVEIRQDPQHIYTGEEFALTLRSFTSGYDLFNPERVVVWHRHHPEGNRKYINDRPSGLVSARHAIAMGRLELLLAGDPDGSLEPYSLGSERSLDDYRIFSGLDCAARTLHPDAVAGRPPDPVTVRI